MFAFWLSLLSAVVIAACTQSMKRQDTNRWSLELSRDWDVLGPFPIQAREQQFLSPSFPLNLSESIDFNKQWPSSYADEGFVSWNTTQADENGQLRVSFPAVRWRSLRATEGWAVLQHHAVLKSTLTLYPPQQGDTALPSLLVNLVQGSYFTILPSSGEKAVPRWYSGNIYAMERALPQVVPLPSPPGTASTTIYDIFVAGDYEIRLFGDPAVQGSDIPVQTIILNIEFDEHTEGIVREPTQDVVADFVGGFSFGEAIGFGFRAVSGWWTVSSVESVSPAAEILSLQILRETRLAPGQTRLLPIRLTQNAPFFLDEIQANVTLTSGENITVMTVLLPVQQLSGWNESSFDPIKATYFYTNSTPTVFGLVPPRRESPDGPKPAILALHGAGVDVATTPFWAQALPRNEYSWLVLPTGRTSWGLDWHGPSTQDAWGTVDALATILDSNSAWFSWKLATNSPVLLMGHSNGGQGAWHIAARYPDRVLGAVPAAAFVKSQAYVPLTLSRSAHYIDPVLRGILESSLTPDDNDLFVTNLVNTPILAVHGGDDENVPVWHSRELVSTLKTWNPSANVTFREVPGQGHWFDSVLDNDQVIAFIEDVLSSPRLPPPRSFTFTVAVPVESGSMAGWRVTGLLIPGRLGRLTVQRTDTERTVDVLSSNVKSFSVDLQTFPFHSIRIDNAHFSVATATGGVVHFEATESKMWKVRKSPSSIQPSGRMQVILTSPGPLVLVAPDSTDSHEFSVALRIAQDLNTYHKLDVEIIRTSEASDSSFSNIGNLAVIGSEASAAFTRREDPGPLSVAGEQVVMNGRPQPSLEQPGLGIMYLHSHPTLVEGRMLFLQSTDASGLEKAARLFPIRTGIPVPDWIIVGHQTDQIGAAGVLAAGVWGDDWSWNEAMSYTF